MKRIVCLLLSLCSIAALQAQNDRASMDDFGRIALTPVISEGSSVPQMARQPLKTKLTQLVTKNGLSADDSNIRFVITANTDLLAKDVTATAPPMTVVEISATLYIGDAQTGQLFSTYSFDAVKGVGNNETRAYQEAVKKINMNSAAVQAFVTEGKNKIIEYYNTQIDFLLTEANAKAQAQDYDGAMLSLASVPTVCKDAHSKAMTRLGEIYQMKIDKEGAALYNQAAAAWKTSKSEDSAREACGYLAEINPLSKSADTGQKLVAEIEKHYDGLRAERKAREEREWQFKQQQYADAQAAAQEQRQFAHEEAMKLADAHSVATQMALQEVKSTMNTFVKHSSSSSILNKITSWFE